MIVLERAVDVDSITGRVLEGRAVSYGRTYRVTDDGGTTYYRESFKPGAFRESIRACRNVFEVRRLHADQRLGVVNFDDSDRELTFRATLDDSEDGDEALERINSGDWRAVSLGFRPRRQDRDQAGVLHRSAADIREMSLTRTGQYLDAQVLAVRHTGTLEAIRERLLASERVLRDTSTI